MAMGVVLVFLHHLALDVAAAEGDVFNVGHDALSIPERPETVKQSPVPDASVFNEPPPYRQRRLDPAGFSGNPDP